MTLSNIVALFSAMVILAAIPSLSVFTVVSRAISSGFSGGLMAVVGIVVGDIIFILIAIYGLSAIAETTMDGLLLILKYFGGAYLIWMGISLIRAKSQLMELERVEESSLWASFLAGLLLTLGHQKAILFYISFFPAFVDLKTITTTYTLTIIAIAITAVGGVKLLYVYLSDRARLLLKSSNLKQGINSLAAIVTISIGIFLIAKN